MPPTKLRTFTLFNVSCSIPDPNLILKKFNWYFRSRCMKIASPFTRLCTNTILTSTNEQNSMSLLLLCKLLRQFFSYNQRHNQNFLSIAKSLNKNGA